MRAPAEIRFRLRQELANIAFRLAPPDFPDIPPGRLPSLPEPVSVASSLRGTPFRQRVREVAGKILEHCFPVLGLELHTGPDIRWRRDYVSGIETPALYFRRVPYLDRARAGDHKVVWEINRHQHLVALAQEYLFSGDRRFLDEIVRQIDGWLQQNPFQRGINWTSALEVAFRALSWTWIWHFVSPELPDAFRRRLAGALYRHGLHLEYNLSVYFSPNTHLLGEAMVLHAIGRLFPSLPRARRWAEIGHSVVEQEIQRQVQDDGSHFERSAYYHLYATDMFVLHAVLADVTDEYRAKLSAMAGYLDELVGPSGLLPMLGDDDGGRLFHPYSDRRDYALETLAVCGRVRDPRHGHALAAWWGGSVALPAPRREPSKVVVLRDGDLQILFDTAPFGPGNAGHSHAGALSLLIGCCGEEVLIDPGTYTYVGDPVWRDRFRGTAMHNTVRIDGLDQAEPAGPFAWRNQPEVRLVEAVTGAAVAECCYDGFVHRRSVTLASGGVVIEDQVEGPVGEHRIEQFWHAGCPVIPIAQDSVAIGSRAVLAIDSLAAMSVTEGGEWGWRSPALGVKIASPVIIAERKARLPVRLKTVLQLQR